MDKYKDDQIKQKYPQISLIENFKDNPFLLDKVEVISEQNQSLDELLLNFDLEFEKYIRSKIEPNKSYKIEWRQSPAIYGNLSPWKIIIASRLRVLEVKDENN